MNAHAAAAMRYPEPPPPRAEAGLAAAQWGMLAFLISEAAFFCTLVAVYVAFMGTDAVGPTPREALSLGLALAATLMLVTSSVTVHAAQRAFERGGQAAFTLYWTATIALGLGFLAATLYEWRGLIDVHHLTLSRNLFGTTFYTLVGFHGLHVTLGVVAMGIALALAARGWLSEAHPAAVELIAWYWHFVDGVWMVVFLVVYVASTGLWG